MSIQKRFPSDGRKVYAIIRTEDNAILSRSAHWPASTDDEPIEGDDGIVKYLPVFEDLPLEGLDTHLFYETTTDQVGEDKFEIKRTAIKRSIDEVKDVIDNQEAIIRSEFVPQEDLSKLMIIGLAALFKETKNLTLNTIENTVRSEVIATASAFQANIARAAEAKSQAEAGQEPDIEGGWQRKQ